MRSTSQVSATAGSRVDIVPLLTTTLSLQARVQLFQYDLVELGSDRFKLDLRYHLFGETVGQQAATEFGINAARLEVKQFLRLDLAHRGAMRAFHIVSVNLQLRLRIDTR